MRQRALVIASLIALCLGWLPDRPATAGPPDPGPQLVLSELTGATSTLWAVDPADPRKRQPLSTVEHADGWGVRASASPDGRYVAYLALPSGARDAAQQAELWLLDVAVGAPRRLDGGLDLLGTPLWAPDSSMVVARRTSPRGQHSDIMLLGYPVSGASPQQLTAVTNVDWAGAIGWWQGALVYANIDASGSYLHTGGALPTLLTTGIARDFRLQIDGLLSYGIAGPRSPVLNAAAFDLTGMRAVLEGPIPLNIRAIGRPAHLSGIYRVDTLGSSSSGAWAALLVTPAPERPGYLAVGGATGVRPLVFRGHIEFVGWLK